MGIVSLLRAGVVLVLGLHFLGQGGVGVAEDKKETKPLKGSAKAGKEVKNTGAVTVPTILEVEWAEQEINPPNLVVKAKGQVSTSGYKDPQLNRVVYVIPPMDGIQDYYLTAVPPPQGTIVTPVLSTVEAANSWKAYQKDAPWIKGIRVHGVGDRVIEVKFGAGK